MDLMSSTLGSVVFAILLVLAFVAPAIICSVIGGRKGYSSVVFLILGLISSVIGLVIAIVVPSRHEQIRVGGVAKVWQQVSLDDGRHLPPGLLCRVLDLRIETRDTEGTVVCQIEDPLGETHWVARSMLIVA